MSLALLRTRFESLLPLVQRAAAAPLLGFVAYAGRAMFKWLIARSWLEIDVAGHSEANAWLELWLSQQPLVSTRCTKFLVRLQTEIGPKLGRKMASSSFLTFVPRPGVAQRIRFQKHHLWITFEEGRKSSEAPPATRISLSNFLASKAQNREVVTALLKEAKQMYRDKLRSHTQIWGVTAGSERSGGPRWRVFDARPSRPLDTVVLQPATLATTLLADCKRFIAHEDWYYSRGIPYRRGYLLYGPPGCGKTSLITALAGELRVVICILSLSSLNLTDDNLVELMTQAPRHSILLLEDVDAAFTSGQADHHCEPVDREQTPPPPQAQTLTPVVRGSRGGAGASRSDGAFSRRQSSRREGVTFAGLLNALDGVAAQEGKMLFMTTNHMETLDEALIRPGRVDYRVRLGQATRASARQLFMRFYQSCPEEASGELARIADEVAQRIPEETLSMATIQGHLMKFPASPVDAHANLDELLASSI